MSDVFDVDALQAEATGEPFTFRLGGEEFSFPDAGSLDWRDAQMLESGKLDDALKGMLGADQYDRFIWHRLGVTALGKLVEAYLKHQGLRPGESEASPSS